MNFYRIAAIGALLVSGGVALAFALLIYLSRPTPQTAGFGEGLGPVLWYSVGVIVALVIAVHLAYARILWRSADGRATRP